ncbi:selenide, water dikinase SelD [Simiduia sp. 21SJ11W-1]|uniref:selenide, water dikinase SelD n=1 Tax=Simiduia sp. 21SJ11W-1 TaxID=2909669 RepID=UPI0020A1ACFC|nr:selenide, water dikinase SelD [Simiduia sp. 21SJ11W-1]UTA48193.1 selenide, water dikinase SelD [Simiduia sp. 21SJ11W-1]
MNAPHLQDLVLLGGGHAHALVIARWAMAPLPGVRLTLVSPEAHTPYSGMLPGLIAGHYTYRDTHIDLDQLCARAQVRFIRAAATGLDLHTKHIHLEGRPALGFDALSINIGATPSQAVPGARQHAIAVKPISQFYARWQAIEASLAEKPHAHIALVGGGAASVELACALRVKAPVAAISLFCAEARPLAGYGKRAQRAAARALAARNISIHGGQPVTRVEPNRLWTGDKSHSVDQLLWCTQAAAPEWLRQTGLELDGQGFIAVDDQLQSVSHPGIFAAGDVASLSGQARPKAGVFAVRQAPVLAHNLRAWLLKLPLNRYRAQRAFLSMLSLGDGQALATRVGGWLPVFSGGWVWRWKNRIDKRFMAMFSGLHSNPMQPTGLPAAALWGDEAAPVSPNTMRCGGCGAKVGASVLAQVVGSLDTLARDDVLMGLQSPDDAAVLQLPANTRLVQSVDQFRAIVDDPYTQGRLAALHALSDLYAMGAEPQSAQALISLPHAREALQARDLHQIMAGALAELTPAGCQLTGGHTSEGAELTTGFVVNGLGTEPLLTKAALCPGDNLILTKPLGTGCLFAARAAGAAQGDWITQALAQMTRSNGPAAQALRAHQVKSCTDVTGFGLLGHLVEMLRAAGVSARLNLAQLPVLAGAETCLALGHQSSLQPQNLQQRTALGDWASWQQHPRYGLLFDPQTNGGLLAGVAASHTDALLAALAAQGVEAACIGEVYPAAETLVQLADTPS